MAVSLFVQVHAEVQRSERMLKLKDFVSVIQGLSHLQQLFAELDIEEDLEQRVLKILETETCILREKLYFELGETWNTIFKWTLPPSKKSLSKPRIATLEICSLAEEEENVSLMSNLVAALVQTNMLDGCLKHLSERIIIYFIESLVKDRNTLLQVVDESVLYASVIVNPLSAGLEPCNVRVPPAEAFQRLEQIFLFLHKPLHSVPVMIGLNEKDSVSLVRKIGSLLCKPIFDCLYRECISFTLAKNSEHVNCVRQVVLLTENFQAKLRQLGFIDSSDSTLLDYLNNANIVFANIQSQELMRKANEYLMQELLQTTRISFEHPIGQSPKHQANDLERFVQNCRRQMGSVALKLPSCQIRYVKDIL